ncbi:MAG: DUF3467 domain-containing protein [Actinomycetota bacterium]|nr:DUF3467 domain-containing protein [Actinomycetota bacterium]
MTVGAEDSEQEPPQIEMEVIVPEAMSAGIYANGLGTWYNATDFTLDFFVHLPATSNEDESGNMHVRAPVQVVARVKIPPPIIFRVIQELNTAMTEYERQFGAITSLGDPIPPPFDETPPG